VVLGIAVLYVVPVYLLYAQSEERMMLTHFETAYQRYQRSTGMLIPRLRPPPKSQSTS
jgi:protein-S-isoprenylcysteine O-methyltransferase Ste14